tara:strand:+ start:583 stop:744 length:162 start_codon:yes stop_codon:yes gene_type:complete
MNKRNAIIMTVLAVVLVVFSVFVYLETHIENNCTDDGCPSFFLGSKSITEIKE